VIYSEAKVHQQVALKKFYLPNCRIMEMNRNLDTRCRGQGASWTL